MSYLKQLKFTVSFFITFVICTIVAFSTTQFTEFSTHLLGLSFALLMFSLIASLIEILRALSRL